MEKYPANDVCYSARPSLRHSYRSSFTLAMAGHVWIRFEREKGLLPLWAEYILYATMPLFHIHTFIALSIVLLVLFLTRPASRSSLLKLVAAAVFPAVIFIWLTTDKMHAGSILQWHLGWTQNVGELGMPFFRFWFFNFGVFLPLAIALVWVVLRRNRTTFPVDDLLRGSRKSSVPTRLARSYVVPTTLSYRLTPLISRPRFNLPADDLREDCAVGMGQY